MFNFSSDIFIISLGCDAIILIFKCHIFPLIKFLLYYLIFFNFFLDFNVLYISSLNVGWILILFVNLIFYHFGFFNILWNYICFNCFFLLLLLWIFLVFIFVIFLLLLILRLNLLLFIIFQQ